MRYLMIGWIGEAALEGLAGTATGNEAAGWTAEMGRRADIGNGAIWARAMARTLERLDVLCTRQGNKPSPV